MPNHSQAYLVVDAGPDLVSPEALGQAIRRGRVVCALLRPTTGFGAGEARLTALIRAVQSAACAALIPSDPQLALALGADGVHLPHEPDATLVEQHYRTARAILGADRIVGAGAGLSRHDAMVLAEVGADYVALGGSPEHDGAQQLEMVSWWAELFSVPCVAWSVTDPDFVAPLVAAGADFVAAGPQDGLERATTTLAMLTEIHEAKP